jgi:transposase
MIRTQDRSLGEAATALGTTLDTVRHILEIRPAPRPQPSSPEQARVHSCAYRAAKAVLPRERFVNLYHVEGRSLLDIAAGVGASYGTVARLARDYDIPVRKPGRQSRLNIDRDWLYEQYVTKQRTFRDIAEEYGLSPTYLTRWAKAHEIPIRKRGGGPSDSTDVAARIAVINAPAIIRPALIGKGGWERLQRFSAAIHYRTLDDAASNLGIHLAPLTSQVRRIERDLGATLLARAERGRPMQLTTYGARVVAAIKTCEKSGGPRSN